MPTHRLRRLGQLRLLTRRSFAPPALFSEPFAYRLLQQTLQRCGAIDFYDRHPPIHLERHVKCAGDLLPRWSRLGLLRFTCHVLSSFETLIGLERHHNIFT